MSETDPSVVSSSILLGNFIGWWMYTGEKKSKKVAAAYIFTALFILAVLYYREWERKNNFWSKMRFPG